MRRGTRIALILALPALLTLSVNSLRSAPDFEEYSQSHRYSLVVYAEDTTIDAVNRLGASLEKQPGVRKVAIRSQEEAAEAALLHGPNTGGLTAESFPVTFFLVVDEESRSLSALRTDIGLLENVAGVTLARPDQTVRD